MGSFHALKYCLGVIEMNNVLTYNEDAVIQLIEQDRCLQLVFHELINKGNERKDALEVLFNINVLEYSKHTEAYEKVLL